MQRRALLRSVALVGLGGCVAPTGSDESTTDRPTATRTATANRSPTPTETPTVTPAPDDPILFVLDNSERRRTVTVTVTDGDETLLDSTVDLAPDAWRELDPGIETTGEYPFTISVRNGPETSGTLTVEPYDVRMGSNVIARLRDDEIVIHVEE